jgi:hypothetical protein
MIGQIGGLLPLSQFHGQFLIPIFNLEHENCWELLNPLASVYICRYLYDSPEVLDDVVPTIDLCLDRLLQSPAFRRGEYRSGDLSGFNEPRLVKSLMFVSIEQADLAARYINGDWSEVGRILPLIDKFVRTGGWAFSVMHPFLTLCERAKEYYPADQFADQILAVIKNDSGGVVGWHGTDTNARIAELVQHFSHRDSPMDLNLAQKYLIILDVLVDMGDRRSAGLQLSAAFREIRLPNKAISSDGAT